LAAKARPRKLPVRGGRRRGRAARIGPIYGVHPNDQFP
jgi:hypothetical protein